MSSLISLEWSFILSPYVQFESYDLGKLFMGLAIPGKPRSPYLHVILTITIQTTKVYKGSDGRLTLKILVTSNNIFREKTIGE